MYICVVPRRITRNFRLKKPEDDEEGEEDDDESDGNVDEQEDQVEEQNSVPSKSNDSKQEEKKNVSIVVETNDSRPRTRRAVAEASDKSNDVNSQCDDDLYTRIKRSRRQNQIKQTSKCNLLYTTCIV